MYFGGFLRYRKKKIQSSVCWVRGSGDYDQKKKDTVICLLGAQFWRLQPEKKDTVVCLAGCAVVLFFVVAGNFDYDRKKKKFQSSEKKHVYLSCRDRYICISST